MSTDAPEGSPPQSAIKQYPINLNLQGEAVTVVGGGNVAAHKVLAMVECGGHVTVIAPRIHPHIAALAADPDAAAPGRIAVAKRRYRQGDLDHARLVLTCTDDPRVNRQVQLDARAAGVWCNSADDPPNCHWTLPAVIRNGPLQVTVSTGGTAPGLAKWLRRRLSADFAGDWGAVLALVDSVRAEVRAVYGSTEVVDWQGAFDAGVIQLALDGDLEAARTQLRTHVGLVAGEVTRGLDAPAHTHKGEAA